MSQPSQININVTCNISHIKKTLRVYSKNTFVHTFCSCVILCGCREVNIVFGSLNYHVFRPRLLFQTHYVNQQTASKDNMILLITIQQYWAQLWSVCSVQIIRIMFRPPDHSLQQKSTAAECNCLPLHQRLVNTRIHHTPPEGQECKKQVIFPVTEDVLLETDKNTDV